MIIVMKPSASDAQIESVIALLEEHSLGAHLSKGSELTIIGVIGDKSLLSGIALTHLPGVDKVVHIAESYKLVGRSFHPEESIIRIGDTEIGGKELSIMAGPCAIEGKEMLCDTAKFVRSCGANFLRGGAYKPRTSPYSFQGLEDEGLRYLKEAGQSAGLHTITEVTSERNVELAASYADVLQVGARNMQNFPLLRELGLSGKPVMLKRGLSATIEEWLNAAEYIMKEGNYNVILCERGIRTFETATRNTLDLSAVVVAKQKSHLPVIVDPSHAAGNWQYISSLSMAAIAAGADGLIIEVHPDPKVAVSDGMQSLNFDSFAELTEKLSGLAALMGRTLPKRG